MSLVGRSIRATLHRLGDALELFEEQRIYLVTQAANDLNITFVVDEEQGDRLVSRLHDVIVRNAPSDHVLGPTWEQIHGMGPAIPEGGPPWWQGRRAQLERIAREHGCAYVYDRATFDHTARQLLAIGGVERVFYAIKANPHPDILLSFAALGLGFECVSQGECERVLEVVPGIDRQRVLFTPNFAPRADRSFDTTGQLFYQSGMNGGVLWTPNADHPYWNPEFVGDVIAVNGKTWPYLNVEPKRYRFLFLNGSNARTYEMFLIDPLGVAVPPRLYVIATDGGYLDAPVLTKKLVMMPGER